MDKKLYLAVLLVLVVALGIWMLSGEETSTDTSPMPVTSGENPEPGSSVHDLPVEPAAARARADLALKLKVDERSIVILEVRDMTWSDGCLGLGGPAESCLQALVPGFRVEMLAQGKTYFYRTDKTGIAVRAETQVN